MAAHGYTPLAVLDDDDEPEANEGERTAVAGVPVEIAPEEARETCAMWADSDSDSGFGGASSELSRAGASIETRDKTAERGDAAALVAFLEANVATESAELIEMLEYLYNELRVESDASCAAASKSSASGSSGPPNVATSSWSASAAWTSSDSSMLRDRVSAQEAELIGNILSLLRQGVSLEEILPQLRQSDADAGAPHSAVDLDADNSEALAGRYEDESMTASRDVMNVWMQGRGAVRRRRGSSVYGPLSDGGADVEDERERGGAYSVSIDISRRSSTTGGSPAISRSTSALAASSKCRRCVCAIAACCLLVGLLPTVLFSCVAMQPPLTHALVYSHLWRDYDGHILSVAGPHWVGPFRGLRLVPSSLQMLALPRLSALSADGLRLYVDISFQWRYEPSALRALYLSFPPPATLDAMPAGPSSSESKLSSTVLVLRFLIEILLGFKLGSTSSPPPDMHPAGASAEVMEDRHAIDSLPNVGVGLPAYHVFRALASSVAQTALADFPLHKLFEEKRAITAVVQDAIATAASSYGIIVESTQLVAVEVPQAVEAALTASALAKLRILKEQTYKTMMRQAFAIRVRLRLCQLSLLARDLYRTKVWKQGGSMDGLLPPGSKGLARNGL